MSPDPADRSEDSVFPDQLTADFIYTLFDNAYFNVHRDEVGDVYLKDNYRVWLFPQQDGEQLRLMVQFNANPEVSRESKIEYVNRTNYELKLVRAYVDSDNDIGFDYYIPIEGGISKRNIVLSVRHFVEYVRAALAGDDQHVLV